MLSLLYKRLNIRLKSSRNVRNDERYERYVI